MKRSIAALLVLLCLTGCSRTTEVKEKVSVPAEENIVPPAPTEKLMIPETLPAPIIEEQTASSETEVGTETMTETTAETTDYGSHTLKEGLHLGMTEEEVLAVLGNGYYDVREDYTIEYDYANLKTEPEGYFFVQFDFDERTLVCYGYHIGIKGKYGEEEYVYSAEELAAIYKSSLAQMTQWYGEPDEPDYVLDESEGVIAQNAWHTDDGIYWLMYGTDLWSIDEPSGINEMVLSCSAR